MSFPQRRIRTAKDANRRTLIPSVRDFSHQVIGFYPDDDGLYLGITSRGSAVGGDPASVLHQRHYGPPFAGSTVTYSTLEAAAHSHLPATFNTPRSSTITPDEVHRRHVARSARLRSRLSGNKQLQRTGVLGDSTISKGYGGRGGISFDYRQPTCPTTSPRPLSGGHEVKRPWSGPSSQFIGHLSPRQRPATTGRYFITGNGLRTSRTARPFSSYTSSSSIPSSTAFSKASALERTQAWVGMPGVGSPGLLINKMKLCEKAAA